MANKIKKLHRKEEKLHHRAERAMKADEKLHEKIEHAAKPKKHKKKKPVAHNKVKKVMEEYKAGKLHSGSKKGPQVKSRKQAIAIALSEARKAGERIPKKKKK